MSSPSPAPATASLPARADVVVIGAGMAGLACARRLLRADRSLELALVEADDRVGGRVGTDRIDGHRCDRGFQLLNPAYPEARRVLDLTALALQPLPTAVVVITAGGRRVLGDPRRVPPALLGRVLRDDLAALGGPRDKLAFARWALACARRDPDELLGRPDQPWRDALDGLGLDGAVRRAVLEPFLSGVVGEIDGSTSRRFVELLVRSFVRGRPSVPWAGMQAIGDQLAAGLPEGVVHLGVPAHSVSGAGTPTRSVATQAGTVTARAVVVATDPARAAEFTGQPAVPTRPLTTFWHTVDPLALGPFGRSGAIHLDGERRSPLANTVVLSASALAYAPPGRALVASTIRALPSSDATDPTSEAGILRELARVHGTDTSGWELVHVHAIPHALTVMDPPLEVRRPVILGDGLFVAGDHRDTASIQGALVSGRRAADAVLAHLGRPGPAAGPAALTHPSGPVS